MSGRTIWQRVLRALGLGERERRSYQLEAELAEALRSLARAERRTEAEVAQMLFEEEAAREAAREVWRGRWERLSPREKQVARLVLAGYSNNQIAAELGLKPNTIKTLMKNVFRKLEVHSRAEVRVMLEEIGVGAQRHF